MRSPAGESGGPAVSQESGDEELAQYRRLNNLKPDTEVLANTIFKSLEPAGQETPVTDIAKGRSNPFLPFSDAGFAPQQSPVRPQARPSSPGSVSSPVPVLPAAPVAPVAPVAPRAPAAPGS